MITADNTKKCGRCQLDLDVLAFSKDRHTKDGLQNKCKSCQKEVRPSKERQTETVREWRKRNPGISASSCRRYHHDHRSKRLMVMKRWQSHNGNAYRSVKKWRNNNPDKVKFFNQNRRSRMARAEGSYSEEEWLDKCATYRNRCAYCRRKTKLTVHHVIPLAKGGSNRIDNVVPACQGCNSSIGTKIVYPPAPRMEVSHH